MRIDQLYSAGIEFADTDRRRLIETVELAERHGLTIYDALYLQLAIDIDGELATLDKELQRAAIAEDIVLVG
jgi:predicted nucleic acid-binding protein